MFYSWLTGIVLSIGIGVISCQEQIETQNPAFEPIPAAYSINEYLDLLKGKKIGMVINHTSFVGGHHLLDTLISSGISVQSVFAPEHGFRGEASAGAKIEDDIDPKTGVKIISIYGKNKKPTIDQLKGIDLMLFDIQDVGARFYTYISTLEYVMEACAENGIPVLILDRPNPNGNYVDGPVLNLEYRSFVGRQSIPIVHGMTVGEYALMLNGERLLKHGIQSELIVIPCQNYSHDKVYNLPVQPSPNLPSQRSIYLYPSLCLIEGTVASLGRGTEMQFQVILHPDYPDKNFELTPIKRPGALYPKHENSVCYGVDLSDKNLDELFNHKQLNLNYLIDMYNELKLDEEYFLKNNFIDLLYGSDLLRKDVLSGKSAQEIRSSWQPGIMQFLEIRKKYLLYPDAEQIYIE